MRSALQLFAALTALVAVSTACLCLAVVAGIGSGGALRMPGGLATVSPLVAAPPGAAPGTVSAAPGPSPAAIGAVSWALGQLGTPYRWGGDAPGGFDCSGLVQAAYAAAGIALPRVAQDQFDAGPHLLRLTPLESGDLVFFGASPRSVEHVGIVVGTATMVDAPHSGAVVRVEPIWSDGYLGATRPAS
ncbi:MAG TPA: C40 family peptidase [Acidimicrobiales bacterium]|nr:C40 family peptidase [Acidimicrobiales bacterium]